MFGLLPALTGEALPGARPVFAEVDPCCLAGPSLDGRALPPAASCSKNMVSNMPFGALCKFLQRLLVFCNPLEFSGDIRFMFICIVERCATTFHDPASRSKQKLCDEDLPKCCSAPVVLHS